MYVYMKECVCVATFSATHRSIALVLKEEGLRFLLPASDDIFRHFALILFFTGALIWHTEIRGCFEECARALLEGEPHIFLSEFLLLLDPASLTLRSSPIIFDRITRGSKKREWIRLGLLKFILLPLQSLSRTTESAGVLPLLLLGGGSGPWIMWDWVLWTSQIKLQKSELLLCAMQERLEASVWAGFGQVLHRE